MAAVAAASRRLLAAVRVAAAVATPPATGSTLSVAAAATAATLTRRMDAAYLCVVGAAVRTRHDTGLTNRSLHDHHLQAHVCNQGQGSQGGRQ